MITNSSLPKIICEMHKPIHAEISQLKLKVEKHDNTLLDHENVQLATANKIEILQTELKTHIQTTSAEYCDVKKTYTEDLIGLQEKMNVTQENTSIFLTQIQENATTLNERMETLSEHVKKQEEEIAQINELIANNKQAPEPE